MSLSPNSKLDHQILSSSLKLNKILLTKTPMAIIFLLMIILSIIPIQFLARKLYELQGNKKYHTVGGSVFNQLMNFNRLHDYMTDLATKHKTYRLISPFRSEVYTSDPANVEYMLKTNFENYGKDAKLCLSDDTLPDGFNVKKGDMVAYQPYAMGRMRFIWGDDAEDFKPERWIDENGCFKHESPFKFTAFQAGPRICLGKEFAYRQMKIFSAVLVRFFIFKLSNERQTVKYRTMINLHIDGGLSIRAFNR